MVGPTALLSAVSRPQRQLIITRLPIAGGCEQPEPRPAPQCMLGVFTLSLRPAGTLPSDWVLQQWTDGGDLCQSQVAGSLPAVCAVEKRHQLGLFCVLFLKS